MSPMKPPRDPESVVTEQAAMLGNRVSKNHKRLAPYFARRHVDAYRLYDWDIPEIRAVCDFFAGHLVVAEYVRTQTELLPDWLPRMGEACAKAAGVAPERVHLRRRRTRPDEGERYERLGAAGQRLEVHEGDLRYLVNLDDYLDTGLFTDHRETRARIRAEADDADFLNLYAYTGSFTCAAAVGGAGTTTTVDASTPYLDWARENLALNTALGPEHRFVRDDVSRFLERARREGQRYTLAVCDPPSFSAGHDKVELDVQRDHPKLIADVLELLEPGGILYFSTSHQRFEPALEGLAYQELREITTESPPLDYRHAAHRAWRFVR